MKQQTSRSSSGSSAAEAPLSGLERPPDIPVLRFRTYLTPSIPKGLFAYLTGYLAQHLGVAAELQVETRHSGPPRDAPDPFTGGEVDLGFFCAPPYIWLRDRPDPPVELVPLGLVFDDPRAGGRPVYFSDVVVPAGHPARSLADLMDARWGYNDRESLSGYYSVLQAAADHGAGPSFLSRLRQTGSHLTSIRALRRGVIDAAAIDSTVLALCWRRNPVLRAELRVVHTLGPWPIQPIVVRRTLPDRLKAGLTAALETLVETPARRRTLRRWLVAGVAPLTDADFDVERDALRRAQALATPTPSAFRRSALPRALTDDGGEGVSPGTRRSTPRTPAARGRRSSS